jgi:hypothetical protein
VVDACRKIRLRWQWCGVEETQELRVDGAREEQEEGE